MVTVAASVGVLVAPTASWATSAAIAGHHHHRQAVPPGPHDADNNGSPRDGGDL
jgi:hypothetical protein